MVSHLRRHLFAQAGLGEQQPGAEQVLTASYRRRSEDLEHRPSSPIPVTINNQTVQLPEREMTGLEIKQAAAEQGLPIDTGFQLSVKHGPRYDVIGDTDTVRIHRNLEFLAVPPDDNS
jgi:hypothetical protein